MLEKRDFYINGKWVKPNKSNDFKRMFLINNKQDNEYYLKEFENAVSAYQKAIDVNPNIVGAHNNLGLVFRILKYQFTNLSFLGVWEIEMSHFDEHICPKSLCL